MSAGREVDHVIVAVHDSGIGIDASEVERVFEPYYQTDQGTRTQGLGLGLTLVKQLVEMHGGSIEARSEGLGKGAEFRLSLPLPAHARASDEGGTASDVPPCLRVLVVDDESDVADAFAALLECLGQEVRVAYDAETALEAAREQQPQVAFLDLSMPKVDGWELARRLRETFPPQALTLAAISGFGKARALTSGGPFEHHLLKPADVADVVAVLNAVAERKSGA